MSALPGLCFRRFGLQRILRKPDQLTEGGGIGRRRGTMGGMTAPQVVPVETPDVEEVPAADRPWVTIVWNDPVNLMSYVTWVFQKLFGYPREKAERLMLDVHHKGKAAVSAGDKEKIEADVAKLHAAGLWATMQRSS